MMISYIKKAVLSGASVIGQSHLEKKLPNQDSFVIKKNRKGYALAVCDGVGSHKYSQKGSAAACKSVCKVFDLYGKGKITKESIGTEVEKYYKKYVSQRYKAQAATTCLFVFIYQNSEIIIGQAGDGVILIRVDDKFIVFKSKNDDFLNEVSALDCNRNFHGWKVKNLKVDYSQNDKIHIFLATDGISEDIKPDKRERALDYFVNLSKEKAGLLKELSNWNIPGSNDDKTAVVFAWEKAK